MGIKQEVYYVDYLYQNNLPMSDEIFWIEDKSFYLKQAGRNLVAVFIYDEKNGGHISEYLTSKEERNAKLLTFVGLCSMLSESTAEYSFSHWIMCKENEPIDYNIIPPYPDRRASRLVFVNLKPDEIKTRQNEFWTFLTQVKILYEKYYPIIKKQKFLLIALTKCHEGMCLKSEFNLKSWTRSYVAFVIALEALLNNNKSKITSKLMKRGGLLLKLYGLDERDIEKQMLQIYNTRSEVEHGQRLVVANNYLYYLEIYCICCFICFLILSEKYVDEPKAKSKMANLLHTATENKIAKKSLETEIQKGIATFKAVPNMRDFKKEYEMWLTRIPQNA